MWSAQFCEGDSSCCSICLICSKWSKCSKCSKCSSWQKLSLQLPQDKFWWGDLVAAVTKRWIWPKIRSICQTWWTYWWSGLHEILFSKITKRQRDPAMQLVASVIEVLHNFTSFHNRRICKTLTQHPHRFEVLYKEKMSRCQILSGAWQTMQRPRSAEDSSSSSSTLLLLRSSSFSLITDNIIILALSITIISSFLRL